MNKPQNDKEYAELVHGMLDTLQQHLMPGSLLNTEQQHYFIRLVAAYVETLTKSEPYLRGNILHAFGKMNALELSEVEKQRNKYRSWCGELRKALDSRSKIQRKQVIKKYDQEFRGID